MPRTKVPGVFCVESGWSSRLDDRQSVKSVLKLLADTGGVPHIYKDAETLEELELLLRRWTQRQYDRYSVAYLGFHGDPGVFWIGRRKVSLDELAEVLEGRCKGKTLYFASCSTLDIPKRDIKRFRDSTKAKCVIGYTTDVDWYEGIAFEIIILGALTSYQRIDAVENYLKREHGPMLRKLGFKMNYGA